MSIPALPKIPVSLDRYQWLAVMIYLQRKTPYDAQLATDKATSIDAIAEALAHD